MKIKEVIKKINAYTLGLDGEGKKLGEGGRDKVLYGSDERECTGIVTSVWASVDVIKEAIKRKANLIIVSESLFWNHGDHTDWLEDNKVFKGKQKLLDDYGITVYRLHEYIYSGIPVENGKFGNGIYYGFFKKMGWEKNLCVTVDKNSTIQYDTYKFENIKATDLADEIIAKLGLNGVRIIGNPDTVCNNVKIVPVIMGYFDNGIISDCNQNNIDVLITREMTDYTVAEYIRDSAMLGMPRAIINIGNFNAEEPGLEYAAQWIEKAIDDKSINVSSCLSCDPYVYYKN